VVTHLDVFLGVALVMLAVSKTRLAPFWFNTLKGLSNLRPAIAATVDSRDNPPKPKSPEQEGSP
jgi:hypothetical protein